MKDPYGVPTGSVPRVSFSGYVSTEPLPPDPVSKAIEQYLLMERKALAWDELREEIKRWAPGASAHREELLEAMGKLVHPAQEDKQQSPTGAHE